MLITKLIDTKRSALAVIITIVIMTNMALLVVGLCSNQCWIWKLNQIATPDLMKTVAELSANNKTVRSIQNSIMIRVQIHLKLLIVLSFFWTINPDSPSVNSQVHWKFLPFPDKSRFRTWVQEPIADASIEEAMEPDSFINDDHKKMETNHTND